MSRFRRALRHPAEVQRRVLRGLLAQNAGSAYGHAHGFSGIRTPQEFARRVPLADYETLAPWIERIHGGESKVLTCDAVTHLIPTSGSTGARKLIPFTRRLQGEFEAAIGPWIADLARKHPGLLLGNAYWSITPSLQPEAPGTSVVPIGFADDASYLGGAKARLVRAATVRPECVHAKQSLEDFQRRTLLALIRERDLRLISVWHPSFLTLLLDALPHHWDELLGALGEPRQRGLCRADPHLPETIWPELRVISCWGDGHAGLGLAELRRRFPGTCVQPKGLLATEAFVTLPFDGAYPLAVCSHFFEFRDADGQVRLAHELRRGGIYEVIVTTGGGLWRYRLGDQVEVTGCASLTPSLRFVDRTGCVSDRFGEKLSEGFVATVLQDLFAQLEVAPRFALLAPDSCGTTWNYTLFVEGGGPMETLPALLDEALCSNPGYAECRRLGQLQPVRVFSIRQHGFSVFLKRETNGGCQLGAIKPRSVSTHSSWTDHFDGDYVPSFKESEARPTCQGSIQRGKVTSP